MTDRIRRFLYLSMAALQGLLALGFILQLPWVTGVWPWPEGRLSWIFLGSVLAAFAAGGAWTGLRQQWRGALAALISVAAVMGLLALALWSEGVAWPLPLACLCTGIGAVALVLDAARQPGRGYRLALWPRISCAVFAFALVAAAAALLLGAPHVFPWPLEPATARAFAAIFFGLSLAYALSAWWADRDAALVAMLGFLAYDLVLLPPFLGHFANVAAAHLPSLLIYVAVLIYSAVVALALLVSARRQTD